MNKIKSIHFVGIKGVGMTPLAIIAKEAGIKVSGSDIDSEFITDKVLSKAGIKPLVGFSREHIKDKPDFVITTGAHGGFNNIEVIEAKKREIKVMTQGEGVGVFMEGKIFQRNFTGISVAGTHGKTTTTAMVATVLKNLGLDPSFVIGTGFVLSLDSSGHYGKGKYFVAEADEYATEPNLDKTAKFLWQHPKVAIITNIEFDHPDVYRTIDEIREAFLKFANQLSKDGLLVACGDDKEVKKLLIDYKGRHLTYGFNKDNDFIIKHVKFLGQGLEFTLNKKHKKIVGRFGLSVFGQHNALNATASIIASLELGLPADKIKKSLLEFVGTKRRSEYIGQLSSGARLYDDYAHHPTEIQKTLSGFRNRFPKSRIVCIFQPHTYSRTKSLFEQFIKSFNDADIVIVTNIYASLRERTDPTISSKDLTDKMGLYKKDVLFIPNLSDVVEYIGKMNFGSDTVIITMGAGDVYKINAKLKMKN